MILAAALVGLLTVDCRGSKSTPVKNRLDECPDEFRTYGSEFFLLRESKTAYCLALLPRVKLVILETPLSIEDAEDFAKLPIQMLSFNKLAAVESLSFLKDMKNLKRLEISFSQLLEHHVYAIAQLHSLEELEIMHTEIPSLRFLTVMGGLKKLRFDDVKLDEQLIYLPSSLQSLQLRDTSFSEFEFEAPFSLEDLKQLSISGRGVPPGQFDRIAELPSIEALTLIETKTSSLEFITRMDNLSNLNIVRCDIPKEELAKLHDLKNRLNVYLEEPRPMVHDTWAIDFPPSDQDFPDDADGKRIMLNSTLPEQVGYKVLPEVHDGDLESDIETVPAVLESRK